MENDEVDLCRSSDADGDERGSGIIASSADDDDDDDELISSLSTGIFESIPLCCLWPKSFMYALAYITAASFSSENNPK